MKKIFLLLLILIPQCAFGWNCRPCCGYLQPGGWWGSVDYLLMWRRSRFFPPIVTTNPTTSPVLSDPATTVLFGNKRYTDGPQSGVRGDFGVWLDCCCIGVGTSAFVLDDEKINFKIDGTPLGTPILGRPFTLPGGSQGVELISFPALALDGHINIRSSNEIWGWDAYLRKRLPSRCRVVSSFDGLAGFMVTEIDDKVRIHSRTILPIGPTRISYTDHFQCKNNFLGAMLGFEAKLAISNLEFALRGKFGLGAMVKKIRMKGLFIEDAPESHTRLENEGFFARGNFLGKRKWTQFEIVSQASAVLRYRFCPNMYISGGYNVAYWPSVMLSGEQLSLEAFGSTTVAVPFVRRDKKFWMQGFSAGLYFNY